MSQGLRVLVLRGAPSINFTLTHGFRQATKNWHFERLPMQIFERVLHKKRVNDYFGLKARAIPVQGAQSQTVIPSKMDASSENGLCASRSKFEWPMSQSGHSLPIATAATWTERPLCLRLCSLIPGFGVKLSAIVLAGPTVLSAVGACPPHDGVGRRWWINVASAVSLIESSQKIGRSHHRHRPGRDMFSRCAAGTL